MITEADWASIYEAIKASQVGSEVVYGKVVKRDPNRKLIWLKEFGDQPIPLVAFNGYVKFVDELGGTIKEFKPKTAEIKWLTPQVGELVLVSRMFGSRRLPKCLGVVLSPPQGWVNV